MKLKDIIQFINETTATYTSDAIASDDSAGAVREKIKKCINELFEKIEEFLNEKSGKSYIISIKNDKEFIEYVIDKITNGIIIPMETLRPILYDKDEEKIYNITEYFKNMSIKNVNWNSVCRNFVDNNYYLQTQTSEKIVEELGRTIIKNLIDCGDGDEEYYSLSCMVGVSSKMNLEERNIRNKIYKLLKEGKSYAGKPDNINLYDLIYNGGYQENVEIAFEVDEDSKFFYIIEKRNNISSGSKDDSDDSENRTYEAEMEEDDYASAAYASVNGHEYIQSKYGSDWANRNRARGYKERGDMNPEEMEDMYRREESKKRKAERAKAAGQWNIWSEIYPEKDPMEILKSYADKAGVTNFDINDKSYKTIKLINRKIQTKLHPDKFPEEEKQKKHHEFVSYMVFFDKLIRPLIKESFSSYFDRIINEGYFSKGDYLKQLISHELKGVSYRINENIVGATILIKIDKKGAWNLMNVIKGKGYTMLYRDDNIGVTIIVFPNSSSRVAFISKNRSVMQRFIPF